MTAADDTSRQSAALAWIDHKLRAHDLPYQIVGGLAAIAHGASRPLHDIDLYAPLRTEAAAGFLADIAQHVVWGPEAVVDGPWDIFYMKLVHGGQKIEIGDSAHPKIRDAASGEWVCQHIDFAASVQKDVFGCTVPVMPAAQLIAYKTMLDREVDRQDISEISCRA
ncbi:hypothetical protein RDV64_10560 [Acuticoccus sp. MNP-M23]|uniref:hypothetical protein n=1 Tax=Acuticoccus sp. MNP-M23 TaxID=3072793 RepID=UPI00281558B6|nr:hypothetical protein [Acuticoccus sp. MNP-M23]WMS44788.1 hypothetical protein RDV64_10560 [Acuticoccus sp. MNP-M23]